MTANRHAIRAIREGRGLGLREFSRKTGISRGFLSQIETGARGASVRTLQRIAEALGVPLEAVSRDHAGSTQ